MRKDTSLLKEFSNLLNSKFDPFAEEFQTFKEKLRHIEERISLLENERGMGGLSCDGSIQQIMMMVMEEVREISSREDNIMFYRKRRRARWLKEYRLIEKKLVQWLLLSISLTFK